MLDGSDVGGALGIGAFGIWTPFGVDMLYCSVAIVAVLDDAPAKCRAVHPGGGREL